jgi:RNA polymerase sigma-70 factor (ECF subfamily)
MQTSRPAADAGAVETFDAQRRLLFGIAYRMLGSVQDAEDVVQETFLRWQQASTADVRSPKAYLSTIVTRLCIDQLRSARAQRETYIGPWLPEPLITQGTLDMDEGLARADSLSMAFLVLLERLNPIERAAFLLRDVFDYEYAEIAGVLEKTEANCRQMVRRARQHVAEHRQRFEATPEQVASLAQRFLAATANGDLDGLLELLAADATLWSDGGGKVAAALNPIYGAAKVARFFIGLGRKFPPHFTLRTARVNGGPGVIVYDGARAYAVICPEIVDGQITAFRIVNNPDKLRRVPAA